MDVTLAGPPAPSSGWHCASSGSPPVLQECYEGVTEVLEGYCVTMMLQ
jgi:hypothetical protein